MEKKLTLKNYLGYALIDLGNNIGFSVTSSYLTVFYVDVLCNSLSESEKAIWSIIITIIMVVARIWDGINDPIMGSIAQNSKTGKFGKFRKFILYGGILLSVIFIVMFLPIKNMKLAGITIFALVTYILYGMIYTVVLVPYGSLATLMTRNQNERSRLSIARAIGGGIGGVPAGMLFPLIIYDTVISEETSVSTINSTKFFICIIAIAVIMVVSYLIGFKNVKENYPYKENETKKIKFSESLKSLIKNKPFIIASIVGMLLIASSMFINTIDIYLFNVYYQKEGFMTYVTIATYLPMIIFIPLTELIIKKLGKKEMSIIGLFIAALSSLILFVFKFSNPWVFLVFVLIQGFGIAFITLEIWAICMDVIDYEETRTGKRNEATTYAIFTFMRKIGQALAAFVPLLLSLINYNSDLGYSGQSVETAVGIYNYATLIPFIIFLVMAILMLFYPLNKKNDALMRQKLELMRKEKDNE